MERNIVEDLHELQLIALEQRLCQALLAGDHDALGTLVSPALFMMDGQGGRMLDLPWLGDGLFQLSCQKDFRAARSRFDAALDLSDKKSHFGLLGMACCQFRKGNYEMALGSYVEALKTPEKCSPAVRVGRAHCF